MLPQIPAADAWRCRLHGGAKGSGGPLPSPNIAQKLYCAARPCTLASTQRAHLLKHPQASDRSGRSPKIIDRPLQQFEIVKKLQRLFDRLGTFAGWALKKGRKPALGML